MRSSATRLAPAPSLAVVAHAPSGGGPFPAAMIQVDDVAAALARCGAYARQRIRGKVVAITGSAGKTTTKEFVAAGLAATAKVHRDDRESEQRAGSSAVAPVVSRRRRGRGVRDRA